MEKNGTMQLVFFFKQKTAYEMQRSLVGSEMCIRDREQTEEENIENQEEEMNTKE